MGGSSERHRQAQEDEFKEIQENWIREQLDDDNADENTEGWDDYAEEFERIYVNKEEHLRDLAIEEAENQWFLDNPQTVLYDSFTSNMSLLKNHFKHNGKAFFNGHIICKMSFSYAVTLMESYLTDTAKQLVLNNETILERSLKLYGHNKLAINQLYYQKQGVKGIVSDHISREIFHNIKSINKLFSCLLDDAFDFNELTEIINNRHDIVHRDGKNIEGHSINISSDDVNEAIELIINTIDRLQQKLAKYTK